MRYSSLQNTSLVTLTRSTCVGGDAVVYSSSLWRNFSLHLPLQCYQPSDVAVAHHLPKCHNNSTPPKHNYNLLGYSRFLKVFLGNVVLVDGIKVPWAWQVLSTLSLFHPQAKNHSHSIILTYLYLRQNVPDYHI